MDILDKISAVRKKASRKKTYLKWQEIVLIIYLKKRQENIYIENSAKNNNLSLRYT